MKLGSEVGSSDSLVTRFTSGQRVWTALSHSRCASLAPLHDSNNTIHIDLQTPKTTFTMFSLRSAFPRAGARAFSTTTPRSLAKMQLIGRLADTPAVNPTSTGRDVIKYAVGVSTGSKDENGNRAVSWFRVASFSEGAQKDLLLSLPKG